MFNQNEIVLIPFPYSDLTGQKQRPALIISNNLLNKSRDRLCCLVTSNLSSEGISMTKSDIIQGVLPFKSKIKPSRLFTIDSRIIKKNICKISNSLHKKVIKEVNELIK